MEDLGVPPFQETSKCEQTITVCAKFFTSPYYMHYFELFLRYEKWRLKNYSGVYPRSMWVVPHVLDASFLCPTLRVQGLPLKDPSKTKSKKLLGIWPCLRALRPWGQMALDMNMMIFMKSCFMDACSFLQICIQNEFRPIPIEVLV